MPEPNRKLGPYTLVSRIGLGGFGVVGYHRRDKEVEAIEKQLA